MKQVGLYEAKSKLSALVSALIESGDPVSLTKHGQVVAEIRLPSSNSPSRGSMATGDFFISPDFDQSILDFQRGQQLPPGESGR
jgi:antitoxin (DNA-binding transcriptional repressor) of toxin-antitoxin stability system